MTYPSFSTTSTEQPPSQFLPLLPSPRFIEPESINQDADRNETGLQIERPRSALHSGDFTENSNHNGNQRNPLLDRQLDYPPWQATSPPRSFAIFRNENRGVNTPLPIDRSRNSSISSSLSSSFVLKPPTSPLVQSESNDDLDFSSQINPIDIDLNFNRNSRRHTLHASQFSSSFLSPSVGSRPPPQLRRDNTFPYQAHQPRRSLTSNSFSQPSSTPQTPLSRSRRPSFSEGSPLHASMVGSYEESILRGRMSTTPSKPLDFLAQIGVLGLGKCKAALRCPPHVTVPFPAVFYSYETTTHGRMSRSSDEPSPYVGQIDLENNLPHQPSREKRRKRAAAGNTTRGIESRDGSLERSGQQSNDTRKTSKSQRRSLSPRAPVGGSYRIPEKGQLQIIIKNPNKTAVKLFLIPYDLAGMEPGTKTFIRQRSYSVGPIIDIPTAKSSASDRPVLRYLVHLHICSPSKGRFYLYKSIRIVFANRVPDGKEKLRNEISLPEPRFSAYKPGREHPLTGPSNTGANVAAEIAQRRRSAGFSLSHANQYHEDFHTLLKTPERTTSITNFNPIYGYEASPTQPIPFQFEKRSQVSENNDNAIPLHSPSSSRSSRPTTTSSQSDNAMSWDNNTAISENYNKLKKGEAGYGGFAFSEHSSGKNVGEGLLARKLKDLGVQHE